MGLISCDFCCPPKFSLDLLTVHYFQPVFFSFIILATGLKTGLLVIGDEGK